MLAAIYRFFIGILCFLLVQAFALFANVPVDDGGLGLNGFLAFLIWIFLMFVFFKVSKVGAAVIGGVGCTVVRIMQVGTDRVLELLTGEAGGLLVALIVLIFVLKKLGDSTSSSQNRGGGSSHSNRKPSGHKCPRCGAQMISVPRQSVPTGRYEIQEGKGRWEYDYSTSQTKSTWVVPKVQVPEYEVVPAHYECPNCNYSTR